jgi:hypothetical protein
VGRSPRLLGAVTAADALVGLRFERFGADEGVCPTTKYVVNFRDITLAGDSRGLFEVVKHDVRRGRLPAKLPQHADDLAAV